MQTPSEPRPSLIGLGFWRSTLEPDLPDPAWFVDPQWDAHARRQVLEYLRQSEKINPQMGCSWCRFRCGAAPVALGTAEQTDGTYLWPEGFAHYLKLHAVRPPDEFVAHVLGNRPRERVGKYTAAPSLTWWRAQRGWDHALRTFLAETDEEVLRFRQRVARVVK